MLDYGSVVLPFLLCLVLTPLVRRTAIARGWMAHPKAERWHKRSTALMGGIAIYAAMALPMLFRADFRSILPHLMKTSQPLALPSVTAVIWIGMTLLFVLGLLDDFIHIRPYTKLVGQILVASLAAFLGFRLEWFQSLTLDTIVTIIWIVGITNAFNLIDNMDGLCAGTGCIAAVYMAVILLHLDSPASTVALILAATLAAFLVFNFNPASIFMGDTGSLPIGYVMAMLCLDYAHTEEANRLATFAVPILVLLVPIFDTTLVTLIRILSGRRASVGGKDHTSHRLVLMGLTERQAVLFLYGIGGVAGLSAYFVTRFDSLTSPAVIAPVAGAVVLIGIYMAQLRVYPEKEFSVLRDRPYTPILMELTYKRQLLLVMLDFALIAFAYYLSYRLRFASQDFAFYFKIFLRSLPAVIACKFAAFFFVGIYSGIWRYMSTNDIFVYLKASVLGSFLSIVAVTFIYRFEDFSKGIFIIDWLLITGALLGTRGSFRFFWDVIQRKTMSGHTVLIYGAGRGGEILLREILNNKRLGVRPVGFIDDDYLKTGKKLQGYPIYGTLKDLPAMVDKHKIDGVLLSFRRRKPERIEAIRAVCRQKGLFIKQFGIQLVEIEP